VVVARVTTQRQRLPRGLAGGFENIRIQLLGEELIGEPRSDQNPLRELARRLRRTKRICGLCARYGRSQTCGVLLQAGLSVPLLRRRGNYVCPSALDSIVRLVINPVGWRIWCLDAKFAKRAFQGTRRNATSLRSFSEVLAYVCVLGRREHLGGCMRARRTRSAFSCELQQVLNFGFGPGTVNQQGPQ
jgi:hypothetical protein